MNIKTCTQSKQFDTYTVFKLSFSLLYTQPITHINPNGHDFCAFNNFEYRIKFLFPLFEQPNTYTQHRKPETQIKYTFRMQSPRYICTHERKANYHILAVHIIYICLEARPQRWYLRVIE